jgi:hypothetical protein
MLDTSRGVGRSRCDALRVSLASNGGDRRALELQLLSNKL